MMELENTYQVVGLIRNDGIRTYRVVEKLSGQPLELHLFAGKDLVEDRHLFEALRALPLSRRRQLIELGEEAGVPYVVTDSLPDVSDIRTYLGGIAGIRAEAVQSPVAVQPPEPVPGETVKKAGQWKSGTPIPPDLFSDSRSMAAAPHQERAAPVEKPWEGGDFTRMFQAPASPPASAPAPSAPESAAPETPPAQPGEFTRMFRAPEAPVTSAGAPAASVEPPPQATPQPGEFTRMFQAAAPPAAVAATPVPPPSVTPPNPADIRTRVFEAPVPAPPDPPPPAPAPPANEPGEFTRMFQSAAGQPPLQAQPAPGADNKAGEFTKFFQSPLHPEKLREAPAATPPPTGPGPSRPGQFTQVFGNPEKPGSPPTAPQPLSGGSATKAFATPQAWSRSTVSTATPQASGPGEYTRMMSAQAAPTLGQSSPDSQQGAHIASKSKTPLYIVFGALGLVLILVVVFFAMRH
jgi:hypothetical protein